MSFRSMIERQAAYRLFSSVLPDDHAKQFSADSYIDRLPILRGPDCRVLDLGCGEGASRIRFEQQAQAIEWYGVDIADSPEVAGRLAEVERVITFDGVNLPFGDQCFDVIFSRQVFEHVRHPDALAREAARVLKPGGAFVGSVAYLEPYHSRSIFNFTPYGVMTVLGDAGLEVSELRPGIDAYTLIGRQMLAGPRFFQVFFRHSPVNMLLEGLGRLTGLANRHRNFLKLQFAGHICFHAKKPPATCHDSRAVHDSFQGTP